MLRSMNGDGGIMQTRERGATIEAHKGDGRRRCFFSRKFEIKISTSFNVFLKFKTLILKTTVIYKKITQKFNLNLEDPQNCEKITLNGREKHSANNADSESKISSSSSSSEFISG
jgi:hypothetical protein